MDELSGSDVKQLLNKAEDWEAQYLKALPKPGDFYTTQRCDTSLMDRWGMPKISCSKIFADGVKFMQVFSLESFPIIIYYGSLLQEKRHTMLQARSLWISSRMLPDVTPLQSGVHQNTCKLTLDLGWSWRSSSMPRISMACRERYINHCFSQAALVASNLLILCIHSIFP